MRGPCGRSRSRAPGPALLLGPGSPGHVSPVLLLHTRDAPEGTRVTSGQIRSGPAAHVAATSGTTVRATLSSRASSAVPEPARTPSCLRLSRGDATSLLAALGHPAPGLRAPPPDPPVSLSLLKWRQNGVSSLLREGEGTRSLSVSSLHRGSKTFLGAPPARRTLLRGSPRLEDRAGGERARGGRGPVSSSAASVRPAGTWGRAQGGRRVPPVAR